jgi:hypothetical protein
MQCYRLRKHNHKHWKPQTLSVVSMKWHTRTATDTHTKALRTKVGRLLVRRIARACEAGARSHGSVYVS